MAKVNTKQSQGRLSLKDISPENQARFWTKVRKTNNHWLWEGAQSNSNGMIGWQDKNGECNAHTAPKISYILSTGKTVMPGEIIAHIPLVCETSNCVNPEHLIKYKNHSEFMKARKCKANICQPAVDKIRLRVPTTSDKRLAADYKRSVESISNMRLNHTFFDPAYVPIRRTKRKLTDEQVKTMRIQRAQGMKHMDLAIKYKVAQSVVSDILNRKLYKDI